MQMNGYRLERILSLLAARGCRTSRIAFMPAAVPLDPDSVYIIAELGRDVVSFG
jgi:hypothetical protein